MVSFRAGTCKAIDVILAGAPIVARIAGTLISVNVAHPPWEKRRRVSRQQCP